MAKGPKGKPTVNLQILGLIVAATNSGNFFYVTKEEAVSAGLNNNPPLIEVNTEMVQDGKAAARATAAGMAMVQPQVAASGNGATSPFAIIKGATLPPSKRGAGLRGGAPKQYPFDTMEVGDSFFVPVSDKHPNPVKTLGSTVSSANLRFAEETGELREKTRAVRGPDRKAKTDGNGNKVMETVKLPVYKHTRKFEIRAVEAGKQYGDFTAPDHGALIARTA